MLPHAPYINHVDANLLMLWWDVSFLRCNGGGGLPTWLNCIEVGNKTCLPDWRYRVYSGQTWVNRLHIGKEITYLHQKSAIWRSSIGRRRNLQSWASILHEARRRLKEGAVARKITSYQCFQMFQLHRKRKVAECFSGMFNGLWVFQSSATFTLSITAVQKLWASEQCTWWDVMFPYGWYTQ